MKCSRDPLERYFDVEQSPELNTMNAIAASVITQRLNSPESDEAALYRQLCEHLWEKEAPHDRSKLERHMLQLAAMIIRIVERR